MYVWHESRKVAVCGKVESDGSTRGENRRKDKHHCLSRGEYVSISFGHICSGRLQSSVFCLSHGALNTSGRPGCSVPLASTGPPMAFYQDTDLPEKASFLLARNQVSLSLFALIPIPDPGRHPGLQPHLFPTKCEPGFGEGIPPPQKHLLQRQPIL